ncbi:MAG: hypothetical protein ABIS50_25180 [Luteolibacter sp.]|uniref:hypothetical protein n=1 Tax=Luteolibacter sp. TaxID=1962973 RepID=UPI0032641103
MFSTPRISTSKVTIALLGAWLPLSCPVNGQDFTTQVGSPDSLSLVNLVPLGEGLNFGSGPGLKGGFAYGLGVQTVYDSNLFLSEDDPESEVSTNLSPWLSYTTDPEGGAKFTIAANYHPVARAYINNPDLNSFDQSGDISMTIIGAKTVITAYTRLSEISGTDRLSGQFVNGSLLSTGVAAAYQIAPRTSLSTSWTAAMSDYGTSSLDGAEIYTGQFGGYWSATERFSFGPAIRYTTTKSDNTGTRDAWALYMQAQYKVGERIYVTGALGVEYAKSSRDDESSTVGMTGNFNATYAISELWAWRSTIQYITIPSPTDTNYVVNNLLISNGVDRNLLRATVGAGVDLNFSNYEGVGTVGTQLGNESNVSTYLSYRRKLFSERLDFQSKIRYSVNDGQVDWNQFQIFAGLDVQF